MCLCTTFTLRLPSRFAGASQPESSSQQPSFLLRPPGLSHLGKSFRTPACCFRSVLTSLYVGSLLCLLWAANVVPHHFGHAQHSVGPPNASGSYHWRGPFPSPFLSFSPRFLPASIVCVRSLRERGEADQRLVPVCLWYEPTQECYRTLIYDFDILDGPCLKYALSKGLGLGIVLGGSIVKIPQVRSSP